MGLAFGNGQPDRHIVALSRMVLRDEAVFRQPLTGDEFGLYAVGAQPGSPQVCLTAAFGMAVTVHAEGHGAGPDFVIVSLHAVFQPFQFRLVAAEGNIEHIVRGDEAEHVGGVRPLLCHGRKRGQEQDAAAKHSISA